jgi:hypothetical protein
MPGKGWFLDRLQPMIKSPWLQAHGCNHSWNGRWQDLNSTPIGSTPIGQPLASSHWLKTRITTVDDLE